jgi:hypothetical protein
VQEAECCTCNRYSEPLVDPIETRPECPVPYQWTYEGKPVTNLLDAWGEMVDNPARATTMVIYEGPHVWRSMEICVHDIFVPT